MSNFSIYRVFPAINVIIVPAMLNFIKNITSIRINQRCLVFFILLFAVSFHAILLFPEITTLSPDLNDSILHYSLCVSMKSEIKTGGNPIDHWVPYWCLGYPVFHYYQYLPHLIITSIYSLLLKKVSMFFIFHIVIYLLVVFYPLILYYSLRKMRFPRMVSAFAALFSLTMSNITGYGLELSSYTWRGHG